MATENYDYFQSKDSVFSLKELTSSLLLWMKVNGKKRTFPNKITLPPEEFIDFIQYTSQFINPPTFLGIPVFIRWTPALSEANQSSRNEKA